MAGAAEAAGPGPLPPDLQDAVLCVDKPAGLTSFDVVAVLRRLTGVRKIGHAGTLDPMATGLLVCCLGKATKRVEEFMGLPKEYAGTLRLGETTASDDAESPVARVREWRGVTDGALAAAARGFLGDISQVPPVHSAIKVGGERLYEKARRGEAFAPAPRRVRVDEFRIGERRGRDVDFLVRCAKGTYIRSLARDLGEALGCGAHLVALRRTGIGDLRVERAWTLAALEAVLPARRTRC